MTTLFLLISAAVLIYSLLKIRSLRRDVEHYRALFFTYSDMHEKTDKKLADAKEKISELTFQLYLRAGLDPRTETPYISSGTAIPGYFPPGTILDPNPMSSAC